MPLSEVDPAFPRIENLEKEVKLIRRKIQQLTSAHDAVAAQFSDALLKTQKRLADVSISQDVSITTRIIANNLPHKSSSINAQIIIDAGKANAKIVSSKEPLLVANEFHEQCNTIIKDNKIKLSWY